MNLSQTFKKVRGVLAVQLPRVANAINWGTAGALVGSAAPYIDRLLPDAPALAFTLAAIGGFIGLCEGYTRTAEQQRLKTLNQVEPRRPRRQSMRMSEPLYEG